MSKTLRTYIREAIRESENLQVAPIREYGSIAGILGGLAAAGKETYDEFFGDDEQTSTGEAPASSPVKAQEEMVALKDISDSDAKKIREKMDAGLTPATKNLLYDASMMKDHAGEIINDITKRIEQDGDAGTVMTVSDYGVFFKNVSELLAQDAADDVGYPYRTGLYIICWTGEDETIKSTSVDAAQNLARYYYDGVITIPASLLKSIAGAAAEVTDVLMPESRSYTNMRVRRGSGAIMHAHKQRNNKNIIQEVSLAWLTHIPGASVAARAATVGVGRAISGGIKRMGIPSETIAKALPSWATFAALVRTTPSVIDDAIIHAEVAPKISALTTGARSLVPAKGGRLGWTAADTFAFVRAMIRLDAEESTVQNTLSYAFRDRAGGKGATLLKERSNKLVQYMSEETGESPDVVLEKLNRYIQGIEKNPSFVGSLDDAIRATFNQITRTKFKVGPVNVGGFASDFTNEYISTLISVSWLYGLANLIADKDRFVPLTAEETESIWQVYTIRDGAAKAINNFKGWEEVYFATNEAEAAIGEFTTGRDGTSILESLKEILTDSIPGLRVVQTGEMTSLSDEFAQLALAVKSVEQDFDPAAAAASRPGAVPKRRDRARPEVVPTRDPLYNPKDIKK